jgi:hypothetical protein
MSIFFSMMQRYFYVRLFKVRLLGYSIVQGSVVYGNPWYHLRAQSIAPVRNALPLNLSNSKGFPLGRDASCPYPTKSKSDVLVLDSWLLIRVSPPQSNTKIYV